MLQSSAFRRRCLIVNCFADETRRAVARTEKIPQTLAPIFLAGWLQPAMWEIRIHNELSDGALEDSDLLGWPDLIVLTGLLTSLDRMRHITAYARTLNPRVRVVGGGYAVRAFPRFCSTFMDVVCEGDVEELADVVREMFGAPYANAEMTLRFDLAHYVNRLRYVESSRYCNFGCSFCTLTGLKRKYDPYSVAKLRAQLAAVGRSKFLTFLDNNFYGSDRASFRARVECAGEAYRAKLFDGWAALVTNDFFAKPANVEFARANGCVALFSGVESFDNQWTASQKKFQNGLRPSEEIIRETLQAGVVFLYGIMLDITTRSLADLRAELDFIIDDATLTLPAYLSIPIPIPRTPFFYDCLDSGLILPNTRVRDLDGTTIALRPLEGLDETARFVAGLRTLEGYRARVLRHCVQFAWHYRKSLSVDQQGVALANAAIVAAPLLASLPRRKGQRVVRTHVSGTDVLDSWYQPALHVDARYESYFQPLQLIDENGDPHEDVAVDIEAARPRPAQMVVPITP